ncbi:MAG: phosphotransferase [Parcubacteria group bacterium]|nr:phosphotransferase [Parcubacteria group bacterium]
MPVQTTINENDFLEILSNYDVGEYCGYETFGSGAGQTTVLLKTTEGKFVLRYYENRTKKHVAFEVQLINFLQDSNYPVLSIIKNRTGDFFGIYKEKPYMITAFIEGTHGQNPNDAFNKTEIAEVIKLIAQLHNITKNNELEFFKDREPFDADYCLRIYCKQNRTESLPKREQWLKNELEDIQLPNSMPKGICHADLNYSNFLFKGKDIVAVLDFDMSFYFYLIYDVAGLIYWWAFPPKRGFKEYEAAFIIEEYIKYRVLDTEERLHIFDALKLIILLGISWGEEGDFESEKEKIKFLNTMGREEFNKQLFKSKK